MEWQFKVGVCEHNKAPAKQATAAGSSIEIRLNWIQLKVEWNQFTLTLNLFHLLQFPISESSQ